MCVLVCVWLVSSMENGVCECVCVCVRYLDAVDGADILLALHPLTISDRPCPLLPNPSRFRAHVYRQVLHPSFRALSGRLTLRDAVISSIHIFLLQGLQCTVCPLKKIQASSLRSATPTPAESFTLQSWQCTVGPLRHRPRQRSTQNHALFYVSGLKLQVCLPD